MPSPAWSSNWGWGLLLIACTLVVHAIGLVAIGVALSRAGDRVWARGWGRRRALAVLVLLIGAAGWLLAVLHGLEAAMWAYAYLRLGALDSLGSAMLYSVDSMATRGASGLRLEPHWRMMGALEAANGMLLFGMSTAFLFAASERMWRRWGRKARHPGDRSGPRAC